MRPTLPAIVGALGLATLATGAEPKPPNVVLIIADDLGWGDLGGFGHPKVRTPNLDALARAGLRFDRAFVTASSCSPSRSSMITGKYPHATGAEELHWPLPVDQPTFVEELRKAGYWTAAAGKWHLGDPAKAKFDLVREANPAGYQLATGKAARTAMNAEGPGAAKAGCDRWVETLRDRPRDRPFFLWLASLDPHRDYEPNTLDRPHRPDDAVIPPFLPDTPEVRGDFAMYYDEVGRLDRYVGDVLAELDRQGVADETLVLFLSDNGRPFPRCKTTLYDSGIRTPMVARWPGRIAPGGRTSALVSTVDIAPTILKLAGLGPIPGAQGRDFSAVFRDPSAKVNDRIFAERNWHDFASHGRAVRSDRFKYIRNDDADTALTPPSDIVRSPTFAAMQALRDAGKLAGSQRACFATPRPREELYDLDADPDELANIATDPKFAPTLAEMRKALDDWARRTGDDPAARPSPDEFDRETGLPLPNRQRPRVPKPRN